MGALGDAAVQVNQSWCKANLYEAQKADEAGDRFCAAGALMNNLLIEHGLILDWDLPAIGTKKELDRIRTALELRKHNPEESPLSSEDIADSTIYKFLNGTKEAKYLAEAILENFKDRVREEIEWIVDPTLNDDVETELEQTIRVGDWAKIIFNFNDADDTTREEVIAMMEKAEAKMQEKGDFEDEEEKVSEAA